MATSEKEYELGPQPLDGLMQEMNLSNTDLVQAIPQQQLSHKMVAKARSGRRISVNIQNKILNALNLKAIPRKFYLNDLFNY